jgi:hypothetical protein
MSQPSKSSKSDLPSDFSQSSTAAASSQQQQQQQQQPPLSSQEQQEQSIDPTLPIGLPSPPRSPPPPYPSRLDSAVYHASRSRPAGYLVRALRAAAYPLRGVWYFSSRREFWPLFIGRLVPLSIISFLVYFLLFAVAFLPQYAFLAIFHGWGAWVNAVVLVLAEGMIIIQVCGVVDIVNFLFLLLQRLISRLLTSFPSRACLKASLSTNVASACLTYVPITLLPL